VPKVLLIDDSQMMRVYLRRCLEKGGFEVEEWVPMSAMEIPDRITESAPDLLLSDYSMTGCNGSTVARMAQKANPNLPIIILTAFMDDDMESNLVRLGVKRVLTKPIASEDLIKAVHEVLGEVSHEEE
jgi:CheY-like chemotaxis protein